MPVELSYLAASALLVLAIVLIQVGIGLTQASFGDLLGARDNLEITNVFFGRAKRCMQNMIEAIVVFAPLILVAFAANRFNDMTALGAAIFFFSRLAYIPLYVLGVPVLRTLAFFGGLAGTIIVALQVVPFS